MKPRDQLGGWRGRLGEKFWHARRGNDCEGGERQRGGKGFSRPATGRTSKKNRRRGQMCRNHGGRNSCRDVTSLSPRAANRTGAGQTPPRIPHPTKPSPPASSHIHFTFSLPQPVHLLSQTWLTVTPSHTVKSE